MKKRLDQLLVERGLAETRQRAQSLIMAGKVLIGENPSVKPGQIVQDDAIVRLRGEDHPFVSRGGIKLEAALKAFQISTTDKVALDIGASTGGFTHVLLLHQIKTVYAVDVGHSQLAWKIRNDPKVRVLEKTNARYLQFDQIGEKVDLIVVDVSFISLEKILPPLIPFATLMTDWITLVKPQFEVGKGKLGKGGIVHSEADRLEAVNRILEFGKSRSLIPLGLIESPIAGTQGNKEFLVHWKLN